MPGIRLRISGRFMGTPCPPFQADTVIKLDQQYGESTELLDVRPPQDSTPSKPIDSITSVAGSGITMDAILNPAELNSLERELL